MAAVGIVSNDVYIRIESFVRSDKKKKKKETNIENIIKMPADKEKNPTGVCFYSPSIGTR